MTDKILRLPLLDDKRYFITGDCHGHYNTLLKLLESANYDPSNDIVITVGDMIDRGSKSYEVIKFFQRDNCYSTLGNHEYMMSCEQYQHTWRSNGGEECMRSMEANGKDHEWLIEQCKDLPWAIEVGGDDEDGAFRVVHAEYPLEWPDTEVLDLAIEKAYHKVSGLFYPSNSAILQTIIWSRDLIYQDRYKSGLPGYTLNIHPHRNRHNYVGHTPITITTTIGDNTFLDTWIGGTLSMMEASSGEKYSVGMID